MRANSEPSFDPASLTWVKEEIEHSLEKARKNLDLVSASPGDLNAIQSVADELHQVTGALLMVGLGAALRLNRETEKLVDTFKRSGPTDVANRILIAKHSTVTLSNYLDNLAAGRPDHPMELAASYVMLNKARGASDAAPIDLFLPDLSAAETSLIDGEVLPEDDISLDAIARCRGMFQAGLLKLLRNKDLAGGARHMLDAVLALEALHATSSSRDFWFTTVGFLEAVANDPFGAGSPAVQLFGKIDQRIKALLEGDRSVPEKLFRDLLLVVGRSKARTERIDKIRAIYRLDELLAHPDTHTQNKPDEKLIPIVDALREQIKGMKRDLLLFTTGSNSALAPLTQQAAALATIGQQLPNREMARLLQLLGAVGWHLGKSGNRPSESQGLEIATALLFVESSLEDFFKLTAEFDQQASRISSRIQNVMTGVELPGFNGSVASLSDTMTLQAESQLLVFQVCREVQANLALVESALDGFFRDAAKIAELANVENLFKQVRGVFSMLEENEAAALAKILAERVAQFANGTVKGEGQDADAVAEGVSALGLYVQGLQQRAPDARTMLLPVLINFGIAKRPVPVSKLRKMPMKVAVAEVKPEATEPPRDGAVTSGVIPLARQDAVSRTKPVDETTPLEVIVQKENVAPGAMEPPATISLPDATLKMIESNAEPVAEARVDKPLAVINIATVPLSDPTLDPTPSAAADELERLRNSEAQLKSVIEERDQRIRAMQMQLVALHKMTKNVTALKAELKELRAALAKVEKDAH